MKKVTAYVHTHWDREWYREFEEFRLRLIEVFDEVLESLASGELPCFYFDGQTSALEDYLEIRPEKEKEIKKLIKGKKLRIGPFYCSTDSFLVSGECFCRNLEIGMEKSKEFGETEFIGYLSDSFGHSASVPLILKSLDIDKACLWRGLGDYRADLNWDGIDVAYLIQGYFQDFLSADISIEKKAEFLKKYLDKIALKSSDNILLPIGADHLAIPKNIKNQIKQLNKIYSDYNIEIATPFEYFSKIKKRGKVKGEFLNNKLNFILPGVYSSRLDLKRANANSQWLLTRIAEPLQAICSASLGCKNKQNEINYAYKNLIKNHAHDSIYGCSIDKVYDEDMQRYCKIDSVSNGVIKRTLRDISEEKGSLSVINLSNFEYNGLIKIRTDKKLPKWLNAVKINTTKGFSDKKLYDISEIPITEDYGNIYEYLLDFKGLRPFSLTNITSQYINREKSLKITANSLENKYIKIEVKKGCVCFTDKKTGDIYKDFIAITDRADIGDSYNFGALKGDKPLKAKLFGYSTKENNAARGVLELIYEIDIPVNSTDKGRYTNCHNCKISIDVILQNSSEYIEFNAKWNNSCKNHLLQIGFNLKEKITKTLTEDMFGTVERTFNPDFDVYKEIPAPRGTEIKPNTSPMQRFVNAQNVTVFTKGLCEYEIIKNTLNITLLRATGIISNPHNPMRGTPAGPPLETPKLQCIGENKADFAIAFVNKSKDMFRLAEYFYYPCVTVFTGIENMQFIKNPKDEVLVYSVKSIDKGFLCRVYNNAEITHSYYGEKVPPRTIKSIFIHK